MSDFKKFCIDEKLSPVQIVGARKAWQEQQAKIDELQKENAALVHVIKSRDIQLENEKHEYDELMNKLVDSGMKNKELQKRVDALTLALDQIAYPIPHMQKEAELNGCELNGYWAVKMSEDHTYSKDIARRALEKEQALKGGSDETK